MELRWYQNEAIGSLFKYFEQNTTGNPIVALPTGTGKSIIPAAFIKHVMHNWPNQRFMVLTHVKELIEQNSDKLKLIAPEISYGMHSAGLNRRDMVEPVIYGGVQSVAPTIKAIEKKAIEDYGVFDPFLRQHFGHINIVWIDECQLLSNKDESLYQYILRQLMLINPKIRVIGLSATPYRMKSGMLTDGGVFTDICFDMTSRENFNRLIKEGFLANLFPRPTTSKLDLSTVRIVGGDFVGSSIDDNLNENDLFKAVKEVVHFGENRQCWMQFCQGVNMTEKISEMFRYLGIETDSVHSKKSAKENDKVIKAFRTGKLRNVANANKLTVGFDHPPVDLIGCFRATLSPGLWVQLLGRGTRVWGGGEIMVNDQGYHFRAKQDCLVLDYARNTERLGPINDPVIPKTPSGKKQGGEAPVKICQNCGMYAHTSVRICDFCGHEFPRFEKLRSEASTDQLIAGAIPDTVIEDFDVHMVTYSRYVKKNKSGDHISPPMVRVNYFVGLDRPISEYVMFEHTGFPLRKAQQWWAQRHSEPCPPTTDQALKMISQLRKPKSIGAITNQKYPEIVSLEW